MATPNKTSLFDPNNPDADPPEFKKWKPGSPDKSNVTIPPKGKERQRDTRQHRIKHDGDPY